MALAPAVSSAQNALLPAPQLPTSSELCSVNLVIYSPQPTYHSSHSAFRNQIVRLAGAQQTGTLSHTRGGVASIGASGTKQKHPPPGTHLWDEAAARHRVEAKLGHILGPGALSPLACQQKVPLVILLNVRPQQSIRMGLGCTPGTWVAEDVLHVVAIGPHMDQQGHAYLKHTGQQSWI